MALLFSLCFTNWYVSKLLEKEVTSSLHINPFVSFISSLFSEVAVAMVNKPFKMYSNVLVGG
jgi:Na+-translocating ferredoxin:NAD+ oxidoreductase RnfE subunit